MTLIVDMVRAEEMPTPLRRSFIARDRGIELHPEEYCLELHIRDPEETDTVRSYLGKERVSSALAQVAAYLELRRELFGAAYIVGVTHEMMAKIAVRQFGFTEVAVPESYFENEDMNVIRHNYDSAPHLVVMRRGDFMSRYGGQEPTIITRAAASIANTADATAGFVKVDELGNEIPFVSIQTLALEESSNYLASLKSNNPPRTAT